MRTYDQWEQRPLRDIIQSRDGPGLSGAFAPQVVRISDEDIQRIANAVIKKLEESK